MPELARIAAENGVTIMQYRDKNAGDGEMMENCLKIHEAIKPLGVPLVVNDRVEVAKKTNVEGVHLGQSDMEVEKAREILGEDKIIGLTITQKNHIHKAQMELLDYVCIGGVFVTESKDNKGAIQVEGWKKLEKIMREKNEKIPVGAIAGINATNAKELMQAGADGVAVISAIFMQEDVGEATREMKETVKI